LHAGVLRLSRQERFAVMSFNTEELRMIRVLTYSILLILGNGPFPIPAIDHWRAEVSALTMIFLAYIMIQVGM
jgi:hypothetical protein